MNRTALLLLGVSLAAPARGVETSPREVPWKAEAELGLINTTGNRQTSTVNGKASAEHETERWRNKAQVEYLRASDSTGVTARRNVEQATTNYKFSDRDYLFGNLRREADRFAGYDYRYSETAGYGRRLRWDRQKLDLEIGAGASQTRFIDDTRRHDAIVRVAAAYVWQFSPNGDFSENAFSEIGSANTHSESETALKLKIRARLAMKLAYKVLNDSDPPAGTLRTDTITTVALVYDFSPPNAAPSAP